MIKKLIILFIFIQTLILLNCSTTKQKMNTESVVNSSELPSSVSYSMEFRRLWNDLKNESNEFNMQNFQPSEHLINTYRLKEISGSYVVSGMILVNNSFDIEDIINLKGSCSFYSDQLGSFAIPLEKIPAFVHLEGLERIELGKEVYH